MNANNRTFSCNSTYIGQYFIYRYIFRLSSRSSSSFLLSSCRPPPSAPLRDRQNVRGLPGTSQGPMGGAAFPSQNLQTFFLLLFSTILGRLLYLTNSAHQPSTYPLTRRGRAHELDPSEARLPPLNSWPQVSRYLFH